MNTAKRKRLEAAGWSVGSTADFLELSPEEAAFVELKLRLSESLKRRRTDQKLSQDALAKKIRSSQSRVAKMEAGDPTVSIDLLIRALLATGATHRDLAKVVAPSGK
jgi:DNA-binding XRE family transcriptional regulator